MIQFSVKHNLEGRNKHVKTWENVADVMMDTFVRFYVGSSTKETEVTSWGGWVEGNLGNLMEEVPIDSWRTPSSRLEAKRQWHFWQKEVHEHKGRGAKNMGNKGNCKWFWVTLLKWAVGREEAQKKRWNNFCLLHNFAQIQAYNHSSIIAIILEIASSPNLHQVRNIYVCKKVLFSNIFLQIFSM